MDAPSSISATPASLFDTETGRHDLRSDFVEAYGAHRLLALSGVGTLFLLPFCISHFLQGHLLLGGTASLVALFLVANALAIAKHRDPPFRAVFVLGPMLVSLGIAMHQQGLIGILWAYAAILLFHFVLPRRTANIFNGLIVLLAVPMAWTHLGPEVTARVAVTLALTLIFTNIFSYVADAQRRREAEQRHRLDLLVRGTHAGTLEWEADGTMHYSRRLLEMLGRPYEADTAGWDFFRFVHADDRERVQAHVASQLQCPGPARTVRVQPPDDYRLVRPSGELVWVHTEGLAVTDARGRTSRYICAFMDITARVAAEDALRESAEQVRAQAAQLEAQNTALREAMRLREEVERIARHDLKAPLASIASVPRLLREGRQLDPQEEELLGMVEHAALRVLSMVNLSLDLYRMEEGSYRPRPQPVDLRALARTVAREVAAHARSKDVRLRLHLPGDLPPAQGEELLCYAILGNLVKNAVEASPEGGIVGIALLATGGSVELRIHNRGAVPEAVRGRFFQKYATHGKADGVGLGAYSAQLMARVQHGELRMHSTQEHGTTLTLGLPVWTGGSQGNPEACSLLLVDDDPYNLMVLRSMLPPEVRQVDVAVNGRAALHEVARRRPDVVFLDLQMPVMGGLEAAGRIRQLQRERGQAPSTLVAFSAHDEEPMREQCLQAGFDHYLVKPASREEVLAVLRAPPRPMPPRIPLDADMAALLPEFVASRRDMLQDLAQAITRGDRDAVHLLSHTLAGSLGMYGFHEAGELARTLERGSATEELAVLGRLCASLTQRFEQERLALASEAP